MTAYEDVPGINWSTLRHMRRSPLHYQHALANARADSDTFRRGRLLHALVLEPGSVDGAFVVWEGGRRAGKAWAEFRSANASRTIVTAQDMRDALAMAEAVQRVWVAPHHREITMQWVDRATGLACKGRLDAIDPAYVTEIKTTYDAASATMSRSLARYDYHCQLAHYRAGAIACGLASPATRARIVAVESSAPYDVAIYDLDDEALIAGEEEVARLLARVAECTAAGAWPGRYTEPQPLSLPGWMRDDESENDISDLGLIPGDNEESDDE